MSVFRVHEFLQIRGVGGDEASEVVNAPGDDAAGAPTSESGVWFWLTISRVPCFSRDSAGVPEWCQIAMRLTRNMLNSTMAAMSGAKKGSSEISRGFG